ncbi:MAG: HPr family phosphocarrier protein [Actinobacteria bacterium]|nr:HPr family phosphocarrier protein [Actinomycetota bacterium]
MPPDVALHARPAGAFVREAASFDASIVVRANDRSANAKSILEVLALGAVGGTTLELAASGEDAAAAIERLAAVVAGLG